MKVIKYLIWLPAILAVSFFQSGCQAIFNLSPDRAAVQEILLNSPSTIEVHRDTIRVLQMQEISPGYLVLATYLGTPENGQISECLALFHSEKAIEGWDSSHRSSTCWPAALVDQESFSVMSGQSTSAEGSISEVSGLVFDAQITSIEVIWDDNTSQVVDIVKRSYLAIRTGQYSLQLIHAYNNAGELVYSYQKQTPAPSKETP